MKLSMDIKGDSDPKHMTGTDMHVLFSETEDDGSFPSDSSFWMNSFKPNILKHIYQDIIDYSANIGISVDDIVDKMAPLKPRETKPTTIDNEAL